jgi:CDP-glucose 4,6-dehydratase
MFHHHYHNRRILVTGHTGFKGSWLCQWLLDLGAEVHGYALDPTPEAILFDQLDLNQRLASDHRGDLADLPKLVQLIKEIQPDHVFHLAAQPLVRLSYEQPVSTFATNVMGTVHVLEALRLAGKPCSVVCVTTDKCYENREWLQSYREEDALGGYDPYSASKGATEIAIASYRRSFFLNSPVRLASARAGNVLGGGDWAADRIVPDCFRSLHAGQPIPVRNKIATRPWQHVLEPLSGYLWLGVALANPAVLQRADPHVFASGFNFGPRLTSNRTVAELVQELLKHAPGTWQDASDPTAVHEASKPVWDFSQTIAQTAHWYQQTAADPIALTRAQTVAYSQAAIHAGLAWAR